MGWWMAFGGVLWLLLLVALVYLAAMLARRPDGSTDAGALETARRRYARGEIGHEEFERIERALRR